MAFRMANGNNIIDQKSRWGHLFFSVCMKMNELESSEEKESDYK